MNKIKKYLSYILVVVLIAAFITGCTKDNGENTTEKTTENTTENTTELTTDTLTDKSEIKIPKYIFLFIGDGMSYPQIQATAYSLGKTNSLLFMNFPSIGMMTTYNSDSTITDSASAATAMATGHKTSSGTLGMNSSHSVSYPTIAEILKDKLGKKIGIITTVSLDHATPAGFFAHQESRKSYYEIGKDMIKSGFDFFAAGGFTKSNGSDGDSTNLYKLAKKAGYKIFKNQNDIQNLTPQDSDKTILLSARKVDESFMPYDMDLTKDEWHLADYVSKGIEMIDNDKGFFMMVEGGKIDYANHSNDAATMISETLAFSDAIDRAISFYNDHKDETLIIVTGDHESGGLTVGYAQTGYETHLDELKSQKISFSKFNSDYITRYKGQNYAFEDVIKDIEELYADSFTEDEISTLQKAYIRTIQVGAMPKAKMTEREYELYGTYEPLTVTLSHIMTHRAGLDYTTYSHTGIPVPVYAIGCRSEKFTGSYDNTDIYNKLSDIMGLN